MATKKKIRTVEAEDETVAETNDTASKGIALAGKFTPEEVAEIDALLETPVGRVPRGSFVHSAVMKAVRLANKKNASA